jgi:hypothetical protein
MPNNSYVASKTFKAVNPAVTTSIAATQSTVGTANLVLKSNLILGTGTSTDVNMPGNIASTVTLTSANNLGAINITIEGTLDGVAITETRLGPNNNTVATTQTYTTVTRISGSATLTAMSVGNTATTAGLANQGPIFAGATRIRGMHGTGSGTAGLISFITPTGLIISQFGMSNTTAGDETLDPYIPDNGLYFKDGAIVNLGGAVTTLTVFYDGPNPV